MKNLKTLADIPLDCIAAPSLFFAVRQGAKPMGDFNGSPFYRRNDVSELRTREEWHKDGRKIKIGETPLGFRGAVDPIEVYADWQTE